jgi:Skp family chaperone for outer membrane proteins
MDTERAVATELLPAIDAVPRSRKNLVAFFSRPTFTRGVSSRTKSKQNDHKTVKPTERRSMNLIPSIQNRIGAIRSKALALALILVTAQAASAGQEQLAASIGETRNEVIATRDQLQATVDSLDALVKQKEGDLKPAYDEFVAQVAKTRAAAAVTKTRSEKMQGDAKTHFDSWQKEIDSIANEKLGKQGQKRLDSVQKSYNKAITKLQGASTSFQPYLSDLGDVTKILSNDLTRGGIKAIRGTVDNAKFHLRTVRNQIFDAIKELESMEKSFSSTAGK